MGNLKREFRLGLVGCGRISQAYIQAIKTMDTVKLVSVLDTRPDAAQACAEVAESRAYTDLESFIGGDTMDGVIICSPPNTHRTVACALMQNDIHVLCEKPFATSYDDAVAMVEQALRADLVLMMASKFRHVEDIIRAKAMIAAGMLGEIQFYENRFCAKVNMRGRWNADPVVAGGGVLIDNGTHSVDIVRYLIGPINQVYAREGKRQMALPVEETTCLSFVTENGVMGSIYLSWDLQIDQGGYINIYGTDGTISIGWQESRYQYNGHPQWVPFGVGYDKVEAFRNVVTNFIDCVRGSGKPVISMEDGLASVEVIEAAYASMNTHNWLPVEARTLAPELVES